ncbi:MAG: tRNA (adenosine(37)-N6)-threonylcarbamoyltransferase complex dimerization subunit type 1 TsaB [Rhodospirillales bacterium]|nr:tRNA (adenosine(37)-N6)-threonylcarbamoyltransferase complex dimerization subunit type 1 TsaB [Rhodospirillales bacterium]
MKILAFDTSTSACSCVLWRDGTIAGYRSEAMARGHSEHLMGMVRDVLAEAGAGFSDLDLLAVTNGPGGFTGIRIGLAAARGMAFSAGLPCLGISTLEAVAAGVPEGERDGARILAVIDSRRGDLFAQVFSGGAGAGIGAGAGGPKPLGAPEAVSPENLADFIVGGEEASNSPPGPLLDRPAQRVVVAGDATEHALAALRHAGVEAVSGSGPAAPDAGIVAALAAARWSGEQALETLRPVYLRPPDANVPKDGGRLRPG